jgi:hypothetical protein
MYNPAGGGDAWDARPSMDSLRDERGNAGGAPGGILKHDRGLSEAEEARYEDADARVSNYYVDSSAAHPNGREGYEGYPAYDERADEGRHGGEQASYPFTQAGGGYMDHPADHAGSQGDQGYAGNWAGHAGQSSGAQHGLR